MKSRIDKPKGTNRWVNRQTGMHSYKMLVYLSANMLTVYNRSVVISVSQAYFYHLNFPLKWLSISSVLVIVFS
jgi:hypothetical protein